jgi:iron complex outermembrane recepter protein
VPSFFRESACPLLRPFDREPIDAPLKGQLLLVEGYMRFFIPIVLLFLLNNAVFAEEPATVTGRIFDATTRTALPEANIWIQDHSRGEVSDFRGFFELRNLHPGEYTLVISYVGYERSERIVTVGAGEKEHIEVFLREEPILLVEEIVVTGTRTGSYVQTERARKDLESRQPKDLGQHMRNIPNVSAIRRGGYGLDPVVRGFKYDQLNVQIDGGARIEGACPSRMDPPMAHLSAGDLDKIEILKGPYALRFGPSFGGVINMVMTAPERFDAFTIGANFESGYETNFDGWGNHVSVYGGSSLYDFRASGGFSDYHDYTDGEGNRVPAGFSKRDYTVKFGLNPHKHNRLQVSYRQVFARDVLFPSLPMDERKDDTSIFILDYAARNLTPLINSINFKMYRSDVEHLMDNLERPMAATTEAVTDVSTSVWGFRAETGLVLGSNILHVGIDHARTDKSGFRTREFVAGPRQGTVLTDNVWQGASITNAGFFAEYRTAFGDAQIIGAMRMDLNVAESTEPDNAFSSLYSYMDSKHLNLSISAGITRAVSRHLEISLYGGRGVRSPGIAERYINFFPIGVDRYDYIGNAELDPEINNNFDIGFRLRTRSGMFHGSVFYAHVQDFISPELTDLEGKNPGVLGVKRFTNIPSARLTGFEIGYSVHFGTEFHLNLNAAYTEGKNNETGEWLPEIPPLESTLVLSYSFMNGKLIPEMSIRAVAGQTNISTVFGESETPGFVIGNIGIRYNPVRHVGITAGINNISDRAYYEHLNRKNQADGNVLNEPGRVFFINVSLKTR